MGEVYRADDPQLKRTVAIKRLKPSHHRERDSAWLLREARRASALNHPHIATVYDVFPVGDELFLVMEYIDGTSLRERLKAPIDVSEFCKLAMQCTEALEAAHEKGILHGDLKPANIMLTKAGDVKVCDFGLARRLPTENVPLDSITTFVDTLAGTPGYIAPELLLEQPVDLRADLFSLGVVFYETLAGRNPYVASSVLATLDRIRTHDPTPLEHVNPRVPVRLARAVHRMLEKDPADRYPSAQALLQELAEVEARIKADARPKGLFQKKAFWAAAALAAVLTALVVPPLRQWRAAALWQDSIPARINLAILPFSVMNPEPDRQALAQGLTEMLSDRLGRLTVGRPFQVSTIAEVRARGVTSSREARDQLGANLVLAGTLEYEGDVVRVTNTLTDTASGRELRREVLTAEASNPLVVQDRVVELSVLMMNLELNSEERANLASHETQRPGAYDFYLQARGYLLNYDRVESLDSAIAVFRKALEVDSKYALAYAGIGQAYWRKHELTGAQAWVEPARAACEGALALGSNLAEPHACLGMVLNGTGEYEKGASEFTIAVNLEPTNDASYAGLATAYERLARLEDAERTYRRAIELRPHYWAVYNALGAYYYRLGRFDDALAMFQQVVSLAPDSFRGYSSLGAVYFMQDRPTEAIASFEHSLQIRPNYAAASNLGTLYYYQGEFRRSAEALRRALSLEQGSYQVWGNLAGALDAAGDPQGAASAFRRARELVEQRIAVNPKNPALHMALAEYRAGLGDVALAKASLEEVLRLGPPDAHTMFQIAVFYERRLKDRSESLAWLAKSVERGQTWGEIDRVPLLRELRQDPRFQQLRAGK
jgi:tetratricopeptide (TPR) repeat protein/TolB-like protein/predicted Ser/Thr protein kinase